MYEQNSFCLQWWLLSWSNKDILNCDIAIFMLDSWFLLSNSVYGFLQIAIRWPIKLLLIYVSSWNLVGYLVVGGLFLVFCFGKLQKSEQRTFLLHESHFTQWFYLGIINTFSTHKRSLQILGCCSFFLVYDLKSQLFFSPNCNLAKEKGENIFLN